MHLLAPRTLVAQDGAEVGDESATTFDVAAKPTEPCRWRSLTCAFVSGASGGCGGFVVCPALLRLAFCVLASQYVFVARHCKEINAMSVLLSSALCDPLFSGLSSSFFVF